MLHFVGIEGIGVPAKASRLCFDLLQVCIANACSLKKDGPEMADPDLAAMSNSAHVLPNL
jgi:hypothetical protein